MMNLKRMLTTSVCGVALAATASATWVSSAYAASYSVQSGDTLWTLSQKYQTSVLQLESLNPSINPMNLQVGQALAVPDSMTNTSASHPSTYVVSDGETFWSISQKLQIPLHALLNENSNVSPSNLYAGITIQLPNSHTAGSGPISTVTTSTGSSYSVSKVISGIATAYTASAQDNAPWGPQDYFGNPLKLGTIAVDPSVIPLGSKLYITGYTFSGLPVGGMLGVASDEGNAIKGNHIDIFMPVSETVANHFGIQNVKIYIIK